MLSIFFKHNKKKDKFEKKEPEKTVSFSNSFVKIINECNEILIEEEIRQQKKLFIDLLNIYSDLKIEQKNILKFIKDDRWKYDYKSLNLDTLMNQNEFLYDKIRNKTTDSFIEDDIKDLYLYKALKTTESH